MLLKTERREVDTGAKDLRLSQNTDTSYTVNLHLHIWVAVGIAEVSQMRSPSSVFCVSLDNDCIFVKGVGECERGLGFLPGVQIVGLLSAQPVRKWAPDVYEFCKYLIIFKAYLDLLGTMTSLLWRMRSSRMVKGAVSTSTSLQYTQL